MHTVERRVPYGETIRGLSLFRSHIPFIKDLNAIWHVGHNFNSVQGL